MKDKKRYIKYVCMLLISSLLFVGCAANGTADSNDTSLSESEKVDNETLSEDEYIENEYDKLVLDKTLAEGKMAVYYFRVNAPWKTKTGTLHGGDSVLYVAPDGTSLLCDIGTPNNGAYIVHALQELGIEQLDYFVVSHPHNDHIGGFSILSRYIDIGQVYAPPVENEFEGAGTGRAMIKKFVRAVEDLGIPLNYLVEGDSFMLGSNVNVEVYNPPIEFDYDKVDYNECSLLLKFVYGESSFLTTGDIGNSLATHGRATTTELISKYGTKLQADVLKMNHHGSFIGSTGLEEWLATVNPKISVATTDSVEDEAKFLTHAMDGDLALHVALDGNIRITTTGDGTYDVQVGQERYSTYYGGLETTDGSLHVE